MSKEDVTRVVGEWKGYTLGTVGRVSEGDSQQVWIELHPKRGVARRCLKCDREVSKIHDTTPRWVRDLPILDCPTFLLVHRCRVACPRCGPKLESLDWLAPYARVTRRLALSVARMCQVMTTKHVAEHWGLNWSTVRAIDRTYLEQTLGPVCLDGVEQLLMDEFALQKGHRYATVVADALSKRVLWLCRGRSREDVRPFFELLGPEGRQRIRAVGMDMNAAYEKEVWRHCPKAEIVYDLFHVLAKYGREVIDRVRLDEAKRQGQSRKSTRRARWILLRNRHSLKEADQLRLKELLEANQRLFIVYVLKEDLKRLWKYRHRGYARRFWDGWLRRALESGIAPLVRFARKLETYLDGILSHTRWPLNTSVLEGINNKIKVIKRVAYGYRNDEYFFLKVRAAFPGISP